MKSLLVQRSFVLFFLIALLPLSSFGQKPGRDSILFSKFKYEPKTVIKQGNMKIEEETGAIRAIYRINYGPLSGTPEEMARQYLSENAASFKMSPDLKELKHDLTQESPAGYHVRFHQIYNNIPVYISDIVISINKTTNCITSVMCNFHPEVKNVVTVPIISEQMAREKARTFIQATGQLFGEEKAELVIFPVGKTYTLIYRVQLPISDPRGDWEIIVDAATGEVLLAWDRAVNVNGSGYIFKPDPLTTAGAYYGSTGFTDNNDANSTQLTNQRVLEILKDITYSGGIYKLEGPYVKLLDWDTPTCAPVTATHQDSFRFTRNHQGFEDVMVYYHIDNNQRYLQGLGFTDIQNGSIEADPHGFSGADNSQYIPSTNRLTFGEGNVDDAEDADVILHEYGHAIQNAQVPGWGPSYAYETRAIGEGFGDYWAGSYSGYINSNFSYNFVFTWDAGYDGDNTGVIWPGRILNSSYTYSDYPVGSSSDVWTNGQIWSAGLWDIYNQLGRNVSDRLVIQSHYDLITTPAMDDVAEFILQADIDLYGGLYSATLVNILSNHEFINSNDYAVLTLTTNFTGGQVNFEGFGFTSPYNVTIRKGSSYTINVPSPQTYRGWAAYFQKWQDGNTQQTRSISITSNQTYTANFYRQALYSQSNIATAYNNGRRLIRDSNGKYHLVYQDNGEIYYTCSEDNGTTWVVEKLISSGTGNNKYPTIVVNGNKIYVLWQRYTSGSNYTIYFRSNLGSSWGSTISLGSISCSSPNNPLPALTVKEVRISGGVRKIRLVAAWKTNSGISFRYSDDDGANWASAALLPSTGSSHKNASLSPGAMFDYSFLDIYASYDNGSNIYLNKYHTNLGTNNTTWGSAETVPGSAGTTATNSQVTSDDMPHAYVVWQGIDPLTDFEAVYYQRKSGIDGSWSTVLCYVEEFYQQPTITNLASGNLALLWDLADYYVYKATYTKSGNTWSSAQRMGNGFNPNPSVSFGNYNPPSAAKYIYTSGFSAPYEIKMSTETLQKPMVAEAEYHRRVMVADTTDAVFFIDLSNVQLQTKNGDMKPMEFVAVNDTLPGLTAENLWQHLETKPIIITGDADSLVAEIGIYGQDVNRLVDSSLSAIVINFVLVDANSGQTLLMLSEPKSISAAGKLVFQHHTDITSLAGRSLMLRPVVQGLISKRQDLLYSLVHVYYNQKLEKPVAPDSQALQPPMAKMAYHLMQNYPNPFNPITRIQYSIADAAKVSLRVYDLLGREVAILVNQHQPAGNYKVMFDASHLASGIYMYRLEAGSFVASKKLALIR